MSRLPFSAALAAILFAAGCATPFEKRLAEAKKGDPAAQYDVALCYAAGRGIGPKGANAPRDDKAAIGWFSEAAKKRGDAELALGLCYYYRRGVLKDWNNYEEAFRHIKAAADRKVPAAYFWMGECYLKGRGVDQDIAKALEWFTRASQELDKAGPEAAAAMTRMGAFYLFGTGNVPANFDDAHKWYALARENDDPEAARVLDYLTRDFFKDAQRLGIPAEENDELPYLDPTRRAILDKERRNTVGYEWTVPFKKGFERTKAAERFKMDMVSGNEGNLRMKVPNLDVSTISWDWEIDDEHKGDGPGRFRLVWHYPHLISASYNPVTNEGVLVFDIGRLSEAEVQVWEADQLTAFLQNKNIALEYGVAIPEGARGKITGSSNDAFIRTSKFIALN